MLRFRLALRTLLAALALLCLVSLSGCGWKHFTVVIPDFDSNQVAGVSVWRLEPSAGSYVRVGRIDFVSTEITNGIERVTYRISNFGTPESITPFASLWRSQSDPDTVTVRFEFMSRSLPGTFKVSTFNAFGDSPLTAESMVW